MSFHRRSRRPPTANRFRSGRLFPGSRLQFTVSASRLPSRPGRLPGLPPHPSSCGKHFMIFLTYSIPVIRQWWKAGARVCSIDHAGSLNPWKMTACHTEDLAQLD
ncbi:hypothetical protein KSP40_PGU020900 [Platanthera guangdongensis]|uniref:Uncharacterized protein n=1 Tax=Platanthera guangdongensis TaxID=2320717 RepID=A0ABR2M8I8_9ASPA